MRLLFLILLLASLQTLSNPRATKNVSSNNIENNPQAHQNPSTPQPAGITNPLTDRNQNEGQEVATDNQRVLVKVSPSPFVVEVSKNSWDKALVLLTGALVLVACVQIVFLWGTVAATRDNAKAAKLSAQAVIDSERAWFLFDDAVPIEIHCVSPEIPQRIFAFFNFKNFGKTVGKMTGLQFGLYITSRNQAPDRSVYDISEKLVPQIIPQGDPMPQKVELKNNGGIMGYDDWNGVLRDQTKSLWLCGILKYEDIFRPGFEHETKICREYGRWIPTKKEPFFQLAGPPEYNTQK
jgi:hypothetical protein